MKLRYHGRTVTVPVIDRGPYVAGRDYDLTAATKRPARLPRRRDGAGDLAALSRAGGASAGEAELELSGGRLGRAGLVALEAGDADAEQPHRPLRVVGAQQLEGDRADDRGVVGRLPRPCASG